VRRHTLLVFLATVFAAKLVVVLQLRDHPLLQPGTGLETAVYTQLATRVAAGDHWLGPGLYFASPLYVYFLAAILAAAQSFTAARVVQIVLGTAAISLIFVAAREWFGRLAAWLAAILAALTGLFTFHEAVLLPSALDPFLTAAALAALARALANRPPREGRLSRFVPGASTWFFVSGVAFGVQALNRPDVLLPAVAIAAMLVGRAMRRSGWRAGGRELFMAAGLAVMLLPITIRNVAVAGVWSAASSPGGLSFYIGNNADADGTNHPVPGITSSMQGQQDDARRVAEAAAGRKLDEGEVSSYFYGLGRTWIRLHPGDAVSLFARKLRFVFNSGHLALNYSYPFYAYDAGTLLAVLFVGPWLLLPLGLVGLAIGILPGARPDPPTPREGGPGPPKPREGGRTEYLIWLSFVPLYALSVAAFFVTERYRLPLLVPMCVGAGAALDRVFRLTASARAAAIKKAQATRADREFLSSFTEAPGFRVPWAEGIGLLALLVLALLVNLPMKADDGRAEEQTRMAEAMVALGRDADAEAWLKKAETGSPNPGLLHFRIGRLLLAEGKPEAALTHFERAHALDPGSAIVEYAIGQALVEAKRFKEAIAHLEAALRGGLPLNLVGFELARARAGAGDRAGALQTLQGIRPQNPADADSWIALGELALQLQSPSLALGFFNEAIATAPRASKPHQQMGQALVMLGRRQEAIAQFQEGVARDPADPVAQLNLAIALAQGGRTADARMHAQAALRLKPDYERARQFLKGLK
jgi:tetratricopeptide (TPR) repeat protein